MSKVWSAIDRRAWFTIAAGIVICTLIYWPGLFGGFVFDDYPNIVDNAGVHPKSWAFGELMRAALSSPSSEFKRPLASLSFAANYLLGGGSPFWMKLTNLGIHLGNGLLVFLLARAVIAASFETQGKDRQRNHEAFIAAIIASAWLLLPINLTAVLYVVQRMESLANLLVLLGLVLYVRARRKMLADGRGLTTAIASITVPVVLGIAAKETAVLLPLYAVVLEWSMFRLKVNTQAVSGDAHRTSKALAAAFCVVLIAPMILGVALLLPSLLTSSPWLTRNFTLGTRLLSEARIVVDYVWWTLMPTPDALSFYHDDVIVSSGLTTPWTTMPSMVLLAAAIVFAVRIRQRLPLVALGIGWYFAAQSLTATILPLELIYEHRNYFASFGLLLILIPFLIPFLMPAPATGYQQGFTATSRYRYRHLLLGGFLAVWTLETATTAYAWGEPLRLARELALRAPQSPRAQYELGRTYIIYSHYNPNSPYTALAYAPLEAAASLPDSSILPQQALIFMNARMRIPAKDAWWSSMESKLRERQPTVQDESSISALVDCETSKRCDLPAAKLHDVFKAATSHPRRSARLMAIYSDFLWNVEIDHDGALAAIQEATVGAPREPAYWITSSRMHLATNNLLAARRDIEMLAKLNHGGSLDSDISALRTDLTKHERQREK